METGILKLQDQIRIVNGLMQKQNQLMYLNKQQDQRTHWLKIRDNLMISGLDEEEDETATTTAEMVTDFFSQTMKLGRKVGLNSVSRIGTMKPRTVLVQLENGKDKAAIFKHATNLKEVRNSHDKGIFVNNQLPPAMQEQRRWYRYLIKYNNSLAGTGKRSMVMKKGELFINDRQFFPSVRKPDINETLYPIDERHIDKISLTKGEIQRRGVCVFIGYAVNVKTIADVRAAYTKVVRLHSPALHIACSYLLAGINFVHLRGIVDDEEQGAGRALYNVMEESGVTNKALFMVRYYGNKHLGQIRFGLMKDAVRSALSRLTAINPQLREQSQTVGKEDEEEITFKKPGVQSGYFNVASPRPIMQYKPNWGSTESLTQSKEGWDMRSRANSLDSSSSFNSACSTGTISASDSRLNIPASRPM